MVLDKAFINEMVILLKIPLYYNISFYNTVSWMITFSMHNAHPQFYNNAAVG